MLTSSDTADTLAADGGGATLADMCDELLSTKEAAKRAGVHHSRIRQLIQDGQLKAKKIGTSWVILASDLEAARQQIREYRKPAPR
jgi:excisionase family DNA binding protein